MILFLPNTQRNALQLGFALRQADSFFRSPSIIIFFFRAHLTSIAHVSLPRRATKSSFFLSPVGRCGMPGQGNSDRTVYLRAVKMRKIGSYKRYSLNATFISHTAR